jgi:hypothetical protein
MPLPRMVRRNEVVGRVARHRDSSHVGRGEAECRGQDEVGRWPATAGVFRGQREVGREAAAAHRC